MQHYDLDEMIDIWGEDPRRVVMYHTGDMLRAFFKKWEFSDFNINHQLLTDARKRFPEDFDKWFTDGVKLFNRIMKNIGKTKQIINDDISFDSVKLPVHPWDTDEFDENSDEQAKELFGNFNRQYDSIMKSLQ